jgi:hypothetical protein
MRIQYRVPIRPDWVALLELPHNITADEVARLKAMLDTLVIEESPC